MTDQAGDRGGRVVLEQRELLQLATESAAELAAGSVMEIRGSSEPLLRELGTRLELQRVVLYAVEHERQGLRARSWWLSPGAPAVDGEWLDASCSRMVRHLLAGRIVLHEDLDPAEHPCRYERERLSAAGLRGLLVVPLRASGQTVGALLLGATQARAWPKGLVEALASLCPHLALALERSRLSGELDREREEHQDTQRLARVGHWRHNFATGRSEASPELYRILRIDPRTPFNPLQMSQSVAPVDRATFECQVRTLLWGHRTLPVECQLLRGGQTQWIRAWGEITTRPDGSPGFVHGIVHDITERRRAQEAIEATSGRLVRAQEEERNRLGRELHDDLCQRVAAVAMMSKSMAETLSEDPSGLESELTRMVEELSELGAVVRGLSHSLYPVELRMLGLSKSLGTLCRRMTMLSDVDVRFVEGSPLPCAPPDDTVLAVYRIAQEALRNAMQHASASEVIVKLSAAAGRLRLEVLDDGVGFCTARRVGDGGLGLLGMQERMRLAGGTLHIDSMPGSGTTVEAIAPLTSVSEPASEPASDAVVYELQRI